MHISEYINTNELQEMIDWGYISISYHPKFPLAIYNYTKACQANGIWSDTTTKCRGLIVNTETGEVIARPYTKFFNYEELEEMGRVSEIPNLPYTISEKVDGSLGIMYWYEGVPYITTKGSFTSEQGEHATRCLHTRYKGIWDRFNRDYTYLFEIVYPEDHHCVSYGTLDDIILTGVINTITGEELDACDEAMRMSDKIPGGVNVAYALDYSCLDWKNIRNIISDKNKEGFVVRFANNYRIKLKYESYWKIHYLRSGLTEKRILDTIIEGGDAMDSFIKNCDEVLDEENQLMVKNIIEKFYNIYMNILNTVMDEYKAFPYKSDDDGRIELTKEAVDYYKTCTYPHMEMAVAKRRNIVPIIWNHIKKTYKVKDTNNEE